MRRTIREYHFLGLKGDSLQQRDVKLLFVWDQQDVVLFATPNVSFFHEYIGEFPASETDFQHLIWTL